MNLKWAGGTNGTAPRYASNSSAVVGTAALRQPLLRVACLQATRLPALIAPALPPRSPVRPHGHGAPPAVPTFSLGLLFACTIGALLALLLGYRGHDIGTRRRVGSNSASRPFPRLQWRRTTTLRCDALYLVETRHLAITAGAGMLRSTLRRVSSVGRIPLSLSALFLNLPHSPVGHAERWSRAGPNNALFARACIFAVGRAGGADSNLYRTRRFHSST